MHAAGFNMPPVNPTAGLMEPAFHFQPGTTSNPTYQAAAAKCKPLWTAALHALLVMR
jgi:hypothetical protein